MPRDRYNLTPPEKLLDTAFDRAGISACPHYIGRSYRQRWYYDFVIKADKMTIAVECDENKLDARGMKYAERKNRAAEERGWLLLRFTRKQIMTDADVCAAEVKRHLS